MLNLTYHLLLAVRNPGAPRRIMSPDFRADTPPNEKAVEALCFLHGKQRHILAAVRNDRVCLLGMCLGGPTGITGIQR